MGEHEKIRASLAALVAGTLSAEEEAAVRSHLAGCPECAGEEQVWRRLLEGYKRVPETPPAPARLARIAALAERHREEVLERRWNRLVLTGLVVYGWALFLVAWPLLPTLMEWVEARLALPSLALVVLALGLWWSFCWVIGLGLLPLLRRPPAEAKEKIV